MSSAVASRLVFLSSLPQQDFGAKVRFLGCVEKYDVQAGILHLRHQRATGLEPELIEALVQVDHVLEALRQPDVMVGAWLHVIANVGSTSSRMMPSRGRRTRKPPTNVTEVRTDAIVVWNAGSLDLQAYEQALEARIDAGAT